MESNMWVFDKYFCHNPTFHSHKIFPCSVHPTHRMNSVPPQGFDLESVQSLSPTQRQGVCTHDSL